MLVFVQVLITVVIGIANLLVVTMSRNKKTVVIVTIIISIFILIFTWILVNPLKKNPSLDLSQYLGHPMNEILEVVPDYELKKKDDGEIKYSAPNLSITGKNEDYLTRICLTGAKSEYSFDGVLLGMSHDDAVKELEKKGYVKKEDLSGNGWEVYHLKNIYIEIHFSDQWIDKMYCAATGYFFDFSK